MEWFNLSRVPAKTSACLDSASPRGSYRDHHQRPYRGPSSGNGLVQRLSSEQKLRSDENDDQLHGYVSILDRPTSTTFSHLERGPPQKARNTSSPHPPP